VWAERIVADASIRPGDLVLDIGAGDGALTEPLVAAGARVIAIELHPDRVGALRRRFEGRPVTVVRADATDLRLPRRPFRVVANPPFAAMVGIVSRLVSAGSRLDDAHLVVPVHAVARWTAPGAPGAGRWRRSHVAVAGPSVPRSAFVPAAPMDCATLVIARRASGERQGGAGRVGRR